jgi:hypothetical protein
LAQAHALMKLLDHAEAPACWLPIRPSRNHAKRPRGVCMRSLPPSRRRRRPSPLTVCSLRFLPSPKDAWGSCCMHALSTTGLFLPFRGGPHRQLYGRRQLSAAAHHAVRAATAAVSRPCRPPTTIRTAHQGGPSVHHYSCCVWKQSAPRSPCCCAGHAS